MANDVFELVPWQKDFLNNALDKSAVILAAATGSGKTRCYEEWMFAKEERPIFVTAPTKALCNEKYRDLKAKGYNVGLETGDVCYFPDSECEIICCTHEIYNYKYRNVEKATVIIDEADFVSDDQKRARIYMESIMFSRARNIFICSASFGNPSAFLEYINRITGRSFYLYESLERLTELEYKGSLSIDSINNSLVVAFSQEDCQSIARKIFDNRGVKRAILGKTKGKSKKGLINECANKYGISFDNELVIYAYRGVVYYYGKLLPKEKLFVEELLLSGLVDTVVGTNALAVGVNFPFRNVVFSSLRWRGELISKSLFSQLAGRAGRKGYFDIGYVYFCDFTGKKGKEKRIKKDFRTLVDAEMTPFRLVVGSNVASVLSGDITPEDDVKIQQFLSTETLEHDKCLSDLQKSVNYIRQLDLGVFYLSKVCGLDLSNGVSDAIRKATKYSPNWLREVYERLSTLEFKNLFNEYIGQFYMEEFTPDCNCKLLLDILLGIGMDELLARYCDSDSNKDYLESLLDFRKYMRRLPEEFASHYSLKEIDNIIMTIDDTVLNPGAYSFGRKEIKYSYKPREERVKMPGKFPLISYEGKKYVIVISEPEHDRMLLCSYGFNNPVKLRYVPSTIRYVPSEQIGRDKLLKLWKHVSGFEDSEAGVPTISSLFSKEKKKG